MRMNLLLPSIGWIALVACDEPAPAAPKPNPPAAPAAAPDKPLASEWPMHRGDPQLQGRAAQPAPKQPKLLWTFKASEAIRGSAAIAGGRVFVGDSAGVVHCLNLADGKPVW